MTLQPRSSAVFGILVIDLLISCQTLFAQSPTSPLAAVRSTVVNVELLSASEGGAVHAQAWGPIFEKLGVSLVIRRGLASDEPDMREKVVGTLRTVTLIGKLERDGKLLFPGRQFTRGDTRELKEWLDELQTYGIQGAPAGKPLWGLSREQFEDVFAALSETVRVEVVGESLPVGIEKLQLPTRYPLRWSKNAEKQFVALEAENTIRQRLNGFTVATALAILLNDRGFGFRPNRTPGATIELLVEPLSEDPLDHWPVGWPAQVPSPQLVPGMFAMMNIGLQDDPAGSVLEVAEELTKTPILVDYTALSRREIDLGTLKVSHPLKKTTWSLALRSMLVPNKLNREYWQDEAGRGFVWITTIGKDRPNLAPPK